jgi:iron complex outermembrane recepter protein
MEEGRNMSKSRDGDRVASRNVTGRGLVSLLALLVCIPGVSLAQNAPLPTAEKSAPANEEGSLSEVVVTAERREEFAQNVPAVVTAISADTLENADIREGNMLNDAIPALQFSQALVGAATIRGVSAPAGLPGQSTATPIYVDGVLQVSPLQGVFAFNNVQRVEVLEGPQGTLFGRNAAAGVINIVTADPTNEPLSGHAMAGYGNYDASEGSLYVNSGVAGSVSANAALYYYNQGDGWGRNEFTGQPDYREHYYDFRGKLRWNPNDQTDVIFTFEHGYMHNELTDSRLLQGTVGLYGGLPPCCGFYNTNNSFPSYNDNSTNTGSLRITVDLGGAIFKSITADTDVHAYWPFDSDASDLNVLVGPIYDIENGYTQEFQLLSPTTNKSLNWILGFFYYHDDAGFAPIDLYGKEFGTTVPGGFNVFGYTGDESYALYAQGTWEFLPGADLTLGGRDTYDFRSINGHTDANLCWPNCPGGYVNGTESYQQTSWRIPTYHTGLDYHFTPQAMVYGTVSSGFNSGQYNAGNAAGPPTQPERITAYEIGEKSTWFDDRLQLNADVYYYNFVDLQVGIVAHDVTIQSNAAAAKIKGAELNMVAAPIKNLQLTAALSYIDGTYSNYQNAPIFFSPLPGGGYKSFFANATGDNIGAPKWASSIGANYKINSGVGSFTVSVLEAYKNDTFSSWSWAYAFRTGTETTNNLDGSINFQPAFSDRWTFTLWGRNLTGDEYQSYSARPEGAMGAPGAPREYGGRIQYKFGT